MTNQKGSGLIENLRVRHDGWTPARQRTFLRALSQTGCVRDACARAGISNTSAYRMKKRSAAFARAWDRALAKAMPTIEQAAYDRAVIGWEEPIVQGGKLVGHKRRYSDSLLRVLLQRGFVAAAAPAVAADAGAAPMTQATLDAAATVAAVAANGLFASSAMIEREGGAASAARAAVLKRHVIERLRAETPLPPTEAGPVQAALDAAAAVAAGAARGCFIPIAEIAPAYDEQAAAKAEVLRLLDRLAAAGDDDWAELAGEDAVRA